MLKKHVWRLSLLVSTLCFGGIGSVLANNEAYPQKPVTVIVSYGPGGDSRHCNTHCC